MKTKWKNLKKPIMNESGMSLLMVMVAIGLIFILAYVIYSRIVSGVRLDFLNKAQLTKNTILNDELKLIVAQGMCGITQLQRGESLSVVGGGVFSNTAAFQVSGAAGEGVGSPDPNDGILLEQGSIFDELMIDSIIIGPYDYRFEHVWADPTSMEGRILKTLAINTVREYRQLNPTQYLAMLYITSHPRAEDSVSNLVSPIPVIVTIAGNSVVGCQSAFSRGFLIENCAAMGGSWSDETFSCSLETEREANDGGSNCTVDDACNVSELYRL